MIAGTEDRGRGEATKRPRLRGNEHGDMWTRLKYAAKENPKTWVRIDIADPDCRGRRRWRDVHWRACRRRGGTVLSPQGSPHRIVATERIRTTRAGTSGASL